MTTILLCVGIGILGGLSSGFFGIGGAIIMIPMLTGLLHYPQKMAQGTTLMMFMIAPSFLAAIQYYRAGNSNIKTAAILWVGAFIGAAIGAWLVNSFFKDSIIFSMVLKKSFAVIMVLSAIKMWFS